MKQTDTDRAATTYVVRSKVGEYYLCSWQTTGAPIFGTDVEATRYRTLTAATLELLQCLQWRELEAIPDPLDMSNYDPIVPDMDEPTEDAIACGYCRKVPREAGSGYCRSCNDDFDAVFTPPAKPKYPPLSERIIYVLFPSLANLEPRMEYDGCEPF